MSGDSSMTSRWHHDDITVSAVGSLLSDVTPSFKSNFSTESHRSCWSCFDNIVYWRTSSDSLCRPSHFISSVSERFCLSVVCHLGNDEERLSFGVWQSHKWSIHSFKMRQTISSSAGSDVNTNTLCNREKMVMKMKMNGEERRHRDRLCFYSACFSFRAKLIKF